MATDTVKWFNTKKGFGFIEPDDSSQELFVQISAAESSGIQYLGDGQKVRYDTEPSRQPGKVAAVNIQTI